MAYRYDKTSGTIKSSEPGNAYSGQGLAKAKKSPPKQYIPPYTGTVSGGSTLKHYQTLFGNATNPNPVHLVGGTKDVVFYRGMLGFAMLGVGCCVISIFLMATNRMPRKERSS